MKNGENIQIFSSNGTPAQKFKLVKASENKAVEAEAGTQTVENGTYVLKSVKNENYVVDISAASKADGGNVQIWENANVSQQRFTFTYLNNGYYKITSENSGKVLDVDDAGQADRTNVQQFYSNGTNAQQWVVKDAGDGSYNIISRCNNKCLDIADGLMKNGENIQIYSLNGTPAQKFKLVKASENNAGGSSSTGTTEAPARNKNSSRWNLYGKIISKPKLCARYFSSLKSK